ncbi:hypothetical protein [Actinobacillus genomosp. 1]|uniref:hypothetical protein n=1 Tax=Actinobacillus genomosp. 1 TaxID=254839 RepID=UPI0024417659|nr:hypothetical protein [Actinobacillus genomosp. 1]WGE90263.1 hypothetical protein NYR63_11280 [Actinobacillus genomosp. 1]
MKLKDQKSRKTKLLKLLKEVKPRLKWVDKAIDIIVTLSLLFVAVILIVPPVLVFLYEVGSFIIQFITIIFHWTWRTYTPIDSAIRAFIGMLGIVWESLLYGWGFYIFWFVFLLFWIRQILLFLYGLTLKRLIKINREIRNRCL